MTTVIDLLHHLGRATWGPVWIPVLAWTMLVLPLWVFLEYTDHLHPYAEYRLYQVLLAALPVGLLSTAILDGQWASAAGMSSMGLSVVAVPPIEATVQSSSSAPSLTWFHAAGLATFAALCASIAGLGRLVVDAIALIRVRTNIDDCSRPADVQSTADRLTRRLGATRRVQVCTAPAAGVPVTLSGLRPTVLLPPRLAEQPDALRMTLIHELVHVRRYDDISHLAERIIGGLFFAHPLVGLLTTRIAEARERACDAAVLTDADTLRSAYARLLAAFAEEHALHVSTLGLSESPASLTTRLRAMQSSLSRWLSSPFSIVATLLVTGIVVTFGIVACSDIVAPSTVPSDKSSSSKEVISAKKVDTPPAVKGGMGALREEIQYPDVAREAGIHGRVFAQFVVDASGEPRQIRVAKSVHQTLDSAAVDAVRSLDFDPGTIDGRAVPVEMTLPITFRLNDSPDKTSDDATTSTTASGGVASEEDDAQVVRVLMNENGHLLIGSAPVDHSNLTEAVRQHITREDARASLLYADGTPNDRVAAAEATLRTLDLQRVRVKRVE